MYGEKSVITDNYTLGYNITHAHLSSCAVQLHPSLLKMYRFLKTKNIPKQICWTKMQMRMESLYEKHTKNLFSDTNAKTAQGVLDYLDECNKMDENDQLPPPIEITLD